MKRKAFTLIEILVVLAIISVLGAVAVTRYASTAKKAKAAECLATRYIVTDADTRYAVEHEGSPSPNMDALTGGGYLQNLPRCAAGGAYAWMPNPDKKAGRRLACSLHGYLLPDDTAVPAAAGAPKSQADCPPDKDFIRILDSSKRAFIFVCAPNCPPGQLHHPASGACSTPVTHSEPAHYCPPGWHWSNLLKKCDPNNASKPAPKTCSGGRTWDEAAGECLVQTTPPAQQTPVAQPQGQTPAVPNPAAPCGYLPNGKPKPCPGHGHGHN